MAGLGTAVTIALGVSQLAYLGAMLTLGVRLAQLARRTRQLPEVLLAAHFLLCCTLGYALQGSGHALAIEADAPRALVATLLSIGHGASLLGVASVLVFNYWVFRRGTRLGQGLLAVGIAWLVVGYLGCAASGSFWHGRPEGFWFWLLYSGFTAASIWTLSEPLLYFVALRKRLRLGLAEPLAGRPLPALGCRLAGALRDARDRRLLDAENVGRRVRPRRDRRADLSRVGSRGDRRGRELRARVLPAAQVRRVRGAPRAIAAVASIRHSAARPGASPCADPLDRSQQIGARTRARRISTESRERRRVGIARAAASWRVRAGGASIAAGSSSRGTRRPTTPGPPAPRAPARVRPDADAAARCSTRTGSHSAPPAPCAARAGGSGRAAPVLGVRVRGSPPSRSARPATDPAPERRAARRPRHSG